uniref:Putative mitochondrial respiratory chain complex i n=1 Tax=Corethrella appendiculata TaxID=1370023 RepID=U5ER62_9DIPT
MSLGPFFRSPFTDLTGVIINHQHYDRCGEFEMAAVDCLEAYGTERGAKKCKDLIEDFNECATRKKQFMRMEAMRNERHRQWWTGERKPKDHYAKPPKVDAY